MKMTKKLLPLGLALALTLTAAACGKKGDAEKTHIDEEVVKAGVLTVGISTDYPPFESLDTQGNIVGYDVDMAKYLADQIKTKDGKSYTLDFVQMEFSNIISARTFSVRTPDVSISVSPNRTDLIETRVIDGRKCLVIAIEDGVEVNGVPVQIPGDFPL